VVIPARNEAGHIGPLVASLLAAPVADAGIALRGVTVADCGSSDATADRARAAGAAVVPTDPADGRGRALRAGVAGARRRHPDADVLWLLHADGHPPRTWPEDLAAVLADPSVVAGAFPLRFTLRGRRVGPWTRHKLHFASMVNRLRYRRSGVYFGDQGLFVRVAALDAAGGVPDLPFMEDVELCLALRRLGPVRLARHRMTTSPRRFLDHGVVTQLLKDWRLLRQHRRGTLPDAAAADYNERPFQISD